MMVLLEGSKMDIVAIKSCGDVSNFVVKLSDLFALLPTNEMRWECLVFGMYLSLTTPRPSIRADTALS